MKRKLIIFFAILVLACSCKKQENTEQEIIENINVKEEEMQQQNLDENNKIEKNNYVSYNGNLSLKGNNIVNEHGEIFTLQGISSHGIQWFCCNIS